MKIRTICKFIKEIETISKSPEKEGKPWTKKKVLVTTLDDNNFLEITVFGDKLISDFGVIAEGTELELDLEIKANEWNGKYFNNCNFISIVSKDESFANTDNSNSDNIPDSAMDNSPDVADDEPPF